jgi:integrase
MSDASAKAEIAHLESAVELMGAGDRPVTDVSTTDITNLLTGRARQPATARKHFGAVSRFLDWVVERGHISINPCLRLPKGRRPRAVPSRPTCPSLADLAAIWLGASVLPPSERDALRWLIAVPCRLREATCLEWRHVDWRQPCIDLPAGMMKNGEPHKVYIPPLALGIIQARHTAAARPSVGLVFPAVRSGAAIESTTKLKAAVSNASGVSGWTIHDFRRGFASAAAEMGTPEPVADAILSHRQSATRAGVLGVYQRSSRWPEQVSAMNAWGNALQAAIIGAASR